MGLTDVIKIIFFRLAYKDNPISFHLKKNKTFCYFFYGGAKEGIKMVRVKAQFLLFSATPSVHTYLPKIFTFYFYFPKQS